MTLDQFIHMNGYGFYIWGSYGFAAVVLTVLVIAIFVRAHEMKRAIREENKNDA